MGWVNCHVINNKGQTEPTRPSTTTAAFGSHKMEARVQSEHRWERAKAQALDCITQA